VISGRAYQFDGPDAIVVDGPDLFVLNGDGNSVTELPGSPRRSTVALSLPIRAAPKRRGGPCKCRRRSPARFWVVVGSPAHLPAVNAASERVRNAELTSGKPALRAIGALGRLSVHLNRDQKGVAIQDPLQSKRRCLSPPPSKTSANE
jgi:hypothetical protein